MNETAKIYKFGYYCLDTVDKSLHNGDGDPVILHPYEFFLLSTLLEKAGKTVKSKDLQIDSYTDDNVTHYIRSLRKRLFCNHRNPKYIKTVQIRGEENGYSFIAEVKIEYKSGSPIFPQSQFNESEKSQMNDSYDEGSETDKTSNTETNVAFLTKAAADEQFSEETESNDLKNEPAPDSETLSSPTPNQDDGMNTFNDWSAGQGKKIVIVFSAFFIFSWILSAIAYLYYYNPQNGDSNLNHIPDWLKDANKAVIFITSISHLALISWAYIYYRRHPGPKEFGSIKNDKENGQLKEHIINFIGYKDPDYWNQAREIGKNALKKYRDNWEFLFLSWVFLYLFLPLRFLLEMDKNFYETFITVFNNFNTLSALLCFNILNEPITKEDRKPNDGETPLREEINDNPTFVLGLIIIIMWGIIELILSDYFRDANIHRWSGLISGILGGLVMARYIGRFQSKFLRSPDWLVVILYLYTVIQPLFIYFKENTEEGIKSLAIILNLALFLKCLLILYMFWLFQSGRLLFYLIRVRRTYQQVDGEWQGFRQVLKDDD
jgi:DNA-binding winged helix-turn-helix (wHTH) protein